ncbi:phage late control D family protein [Vibrio cincinnatiensis]|uniref:phage late control D family protein n=1 Tax=Vibrio cincinnatiensis TaxID=675 RepID=UPI001302D44C|nr:hypothetical protein [Vibrio cincinnatiensis]
MGLAAFKIVADGKDITAIIKPRFISLSITDEAGIKSDNFTLVLADDGKIVFPKTEAKLQISTGESTKALTNRGTFVVNTVKLSSPEQTITLSGDAANLSGEFKNQRDQTWENITLKSLVETIAARCSYQPAVSEAYDLVQITHRLQTGQSDADLLTELATEHNATMKVTRGKLVFFPKGDNQSVSGKTLPAIPVYLTNQVQATITLSGAAKFDAVVAKWRDTDLAETKTVRVGEASGKARTLNTLFQDEATARSAAEAELHNLKRAAYSLEIDELPFIPGVVAERNILLSGHHRPQFNGEWMCESVTETLDDNGHMLSGHFVAPKVKVGEIPSLS